MLKDTQLHILADSDEHEAVHQVQVNLHFAKIIPKNCFYLNIFPINTRKQPLDMRGTGGIVSLTVAGSSCNMLPFIFSIYLFVQGVWIWMADLWGIVLQNQ